MNNVSKYRSQAKLSQRALASLAGVSQQTIQRIEAEAVTVRFETALALSSALKTPLRELFPEIRDRAALEGRAPQQAAEKIDYSHCSHTLKIMFVGGLLKFYSVDEATAQRFRSCLFDGQEFIAFDTDTHSVVVNSKLIQWTNVLFDPGVVRDGANDDLLGPLTIYFSDSIEPHTFEVDADSSHLDDEASEGGAQLQDLVFSLDLPSDARSVVSFIDCDGEEVIFNPAIMTALEIPLSAVNPMLSQAIWSGMEEDEE